MKVSKKSIKFLWIFIFLVVVVFVLGKIREKYLSDNSEKSFPDSSNIMGKFGNETDLVIKEIDHPIYESVTWRKNDYIRFMRFPNMNTKFYKSYENTDELLEDCEKVKLVLENAGFSIDDSRKTLNTSDGGSLFIANDIWTNGERLVAIQGVENDSVVNLPAANLTISDLGTVKEINDFESSLWDVLDAYNTNFKNIMVDKYGESKRGADYAVGVLVKVSLENELPILFTYYPSWINRNIKRELLVISHQASDDGFVYYEKNEKTGKINLLLTSDNSYTCDELKEKNISKDEAEKILDVLENSYLTNDETGEVYVNVNGDKMRQFFDKGINQLNLENCIVNN